jgi:structural maintenance of chromosome 3 (chondroitin sulfate proteoglycan 6)
LTYIEQRLEELEQEKKELKEYQEQDREKRCLEYALHYRELDDVSKALEQVSFHIVHD